MFGMISRIGGAELIIILSVLLLIVGPAKLPGLARSAAEGLGKAKKAKKDLHEEIDALNPLSGIKADIDSVNPVKIVKSQFEDPQTTDRKKGSDKKSGS